MENRRPSSTKSAGPSKNYPSNRRGGGDSARTGRGDPRQQPSGRQRFGDGTSVDPYSTRAGRARGGTPGGRKKTLSSWDRRAEIKITSELQLTDGKFRGKFFKTNPSPQMVPTRRRLRELFFKILSRRIRAGRFLDLCSGCGTMGLEAISRGAMLSTFVERSARMAALIRKNSEELGIRNGHSEIIEGEAAPFLKRALAKRRSWDVVYFCMPADGSDDIFRFLGRGAAVGRGGILVVEHPSETLIPENVGVLKRSRTLMQDDVTLTFLERPVPVSK
jgi:16S rRNA (guanine966-N2)-methyltransferase